MEAQQIVGARLKEIRSQLGLTQLDFANQIGCSRVAYAYYEAGRRPPDINFLFSLKKITGYSFDYILGNTDNPTMETAGLDKTIGLSTKALDTLKAKDRAGATVNRILESKKAVRLSSELSAFNHFTACYHMTCNHEFSEDEQDKCEEIAEAYLPIIIDSLRDIFSARNEIDSYYFTMPSPEELKAYLDNTLEIKKQFSHSIAPYTPNMRAKMNRIIHEERRRKIGDKTIFEDDEEKKDHP